MTSWKTRIVLVALIVGCSSGEDISIPKHIKDLSKLTAYPETTNPSGTIQLIHEKNFGITDSVLSGQLGKIDVDEKGNVYISDVSQNTIHIYQPDGSYLTDLGHEGDGPGEFRNIRNIKIHSDLLFASDQALHRVNIYSLASLEPINPIELNPRNWNDIEELSRAHPNWSFYPLSDHELLFGFDIVHAPDNVVTKYFYLNKWGEVISDKILEQQDVNLFVIKGKTPLVTKLPFSRKSLFSVSPKGHLYSAWTEDFLIKVYNSSGEYVRAFFYHYKKSELHRNEVINGYPEGALRKGVRKAEFPNTWPALADLLIDDENRLWISTIVEDFDVYQWWVLKDTGKLLARFTWPRNKPIKVVKNNKLYTRETDEETGLQQIVRYRIEMEPREK